MSLQPLYYNQIKNIGYISITLVFKFNDEQILSAHSGTPHLIEHMLFRNLGGKSINELNEQFSRMGTEIYAKTTYDSIILRFNVINKNFPYAIEYIKLLLSEQCWSEDEFKLEKEAVLREIEIKQNSFSKRIKELYNNRLLNRNLCGTFSSVKRITRKAALEYYKNLISKDNMICIISGDYSNKQLAQLKSLNDSKEIRTNSISLVPDSFNKRDGDALAIFDDDNISGIYFNFDIEKKYQKAAKFIQYYLSGYTSPLSSDLVDKKSICYEVECALDEWRDFSELIFYLEVRYDLLSEAINGFALSIKSVVNNFSISDYESVLNYIITERTKDECNAEEMNNIIYNLYIKEIPDEIPTFNEVKTALSSIIRKHNYSVCCYYSSKRSEVLKQLKLAEKTMFEL